jgi:hypothetical protein
MTATKNYLLGHKIEGYNIADITAAGGKGTFAFWVKSPKTGTHCLAMKSSDGTRSYVAEYTVTAVNTWERKVITVDFAGAITAGAWNFTNGIGIQLWWALMAGSNFQGTAGAWTTANLFASTNQQNLLDTVGNTFKITDVMFVPGSSAPAFELRSFADELQLCMRYYQKSYQIADKPGSAVTSATGQLLGMANASGLLYLNWPLPTRMRATPTGTAYSYITGASGKVRDDTAAADVVVSTLVVGEGSITFITPMTSAHQGQVHYTVDAEL